ncbi:MAG: hypothetical protein QOI66_3735 [Myxococcales bacterium]|jgi:hypothetical protein|nr:hypothetical protein [Myxococcales bacterium]
MQSLFFVQVVRQAAAGPQTNGSQTCPLTIPQPSAAQREAAVSVAPTQVAGLQIVPTEYLRHWPAPSQVPSRPQLAGISSGQSLWGSVPTSAGRQTPRLPEMVHDWQIPSHRAAQQTLSLQKPLSHWLSWLQVTPLADGGVTIGTSFPASVSTLAPPVPVLLSVPPVPLPTAPPDPPPPPGDAPPVPMMAMASG